VAARDQSGYIPFVGHRTLDVDNSLNDNALRAKLLSGLQEPAFPGSSRIEALKEGREHRDPVNSSPDMLLVSRALGWNRSP
jgi:hypothetical protein